MKAERRPQRVFPGRRGSAPTCRRLCDLLVPATSGGGAREDCRVRIGTWNMEGRWSADHAELLLAQGCDVWLLTEVHEATQLPGSAMRLTTGRMGDHKYWAGVCTRGPLKPFTDPHPASAAVAFHGLVWCSSILPWRSCGDTVWGSGSTAEKTVRAVAQLMRSLPPGDLVWGGDWNHAMIGREYVGSLPGRAAIDHELTERRLQLATRHSPHRIPGLLSIDHIAVPRVARVLASRRTVAEDHGGRRLSDHDAYTTEIELP